jgi:AraC-like DNA-binding protein
MVDSRPDRWLAGELGTEGPAKRVDLGVFLFRWDETLPDYPRIGHAHACLELGIVLSGRILVFFDEAEVSCGPGDLWLCSMWERHGWQIKELGSSTVFAILRPELLLDLPDGDPPYLELFALPPDERARGLDAAARNRFAAIGSDLAREADGREPYSPALARLGVLRTLAELSRLRASEAGSLSGGASDRRVSLARLIPVLRLVHEEPWRHLAAREAAARCSMSVSSFHRTFRRAMGMSFSTFRQRVRAAYAAHLLVSDDSTVARVASDAGFTDISHLNRAFRSQYGCTPSEYRARQR